MPPAKKRLPSFGDAAKSGSSSSRTSSRSTASSETTRRRSSSSTSARQWGKSFTSALDAIEFANRTPGSLIRYVAGSQKSRSARSSVRSSAKSSATALPTFVPSTTLPILAGASPTALRFTLPLRTTATQTTHEVSAPTAVTLKKLDSLTTWDTSSLAFCFPRPRRPAGKSVLISTPPETPAHDFWSFADRAEASGAYIVRTIDDDKHTPDAEKEVLIREMGGRDSTRAQRELWCARIVDEERAVLPEFAGERATRMISEVPGPTYEQPLVSMDLGWEDRTGLLFGYYDFKRAKLCHPARGAPAPRPYRPDRRPGQGDRGGAVAREARPAAHLRCPVAGPGRHRFVPQVSRLRADEGRDGGDDQPGCACG